MRPRLVGVEASDEDESLVIDAAPVISILYTTRIGEFHPVGAVLGESRRIVGSFDRLFSSQVRARKRMASASPGSSAGDPMRSHWIAIRSQSLDVLEIRRWDRGHIGYPSVVEPIQG